jgi:hypothetical protein
MFYGIIYQDGALIDHCVIDVRDIDNYKFYNALRPHIVRQQRFKSQENAYAWASKIYKQYCTDLSRANG